MDAAKISALEELEPVNRQSHGGKIHPITHHYLPGSPSLGETKMDEWIGSGLFLKELAARRSVGHLTMRHGAAGQLRL